MSSALVIMLTKYPQPGYAKTRLISAYGSEGAARVQYYMTKKCVQAVQPLSENEWDLRIAYAGGDHVGEHAMQAWLGEEHRFVPQPPGDLGERLSKLIDQGFGDGYQST